ncbi:hypothetical protein Fmac_011773 [Flemingia macrophylla]|uniref:Uncharacterized protein n=1 Tax=Flemingia macrophylla TaxID=520843 RepID=A0ABD1MNF1_9FABA
METFSLGLASLHLHPPQPPPTHDQDDPQSNDNDLDDHDGFLFYSPDARHLPEMLGIFCAVALPFDMLLKAFTELNLEHTDEEATFLLHPSRLQRR